MAIYATFNCRMLVKPMIWTATLKVASVKSTLLISNPSVEKKSVPL